ncbi:MAG TPA: hypothetical protein VF498_07035 [Anaerolineales bacterium]
MKPKYSLCLLILALALGVALSACQAAPSTGPAQQGTPVPAQPASTQAPAAAAAQGTAAPTLIAVVPTPSDPSKATITGYLMEHPNSPQPANWFFILYLAEVQTDKNGTPMIAGFSVRSAISTQPDSAGRFVFENVPAGKKYALVMDMVNTSFMLKDPKTGADMLWEPKAGQILDVGKLVYSSLPGSPAPASTASPTP